MKKKVEMGVMKHWV